MQAADQPYVSMRETGQALWFLGVLTQVKATGEQTGGPTASLNTSSPLVLPPPGTCIMLRTRPFM